MTDDQNDPPFLAQLIQLAQKSQPERSADDLRAELLAIANRKTSHPDPMLAPWVAIPEIPAWPHIGWRMGGGEDYFGDFAQWLRDLPEAKRAAYIASNPEPQSYKGLYAAILERS